MPDATGQYAVEIDAEDDVGLDSVILRYTRVAGSGEAFTFEEGDVPVRLQVASGTSWKAHATLALLEPEAGGRRYARVPRHRPRPEAGRRSCNVGDVP